MSADDNEVPVTSPGQDAQPQPASAAPQPDTSTNVVDQIAESLKAGTFDEAPAPAAPAPKSEDPPAPTAPAAEKPATQNPTAPAPTAPATPPEPEDPAAAYDHPDDPSVDEIDPKFTKIRKNFEKMRSTLREARRELEGHARIRDAAKAANMDDKLFETWNLLGARANLCDKGAIQELDRILTHVKREAGIEASSAPPAAQAPVMTAEQAYDTFFKAKVESYQMDPEAAKEAAAAIAQRFSPAAPTTPAPSQLRQQVPPQPAPQTYQQPPQMETIEDRVQRSMALRDQQYAKTIPRWAEVQKLAFELVQQDKARGVQLDPLQWQSDWDSKVRQAQLKLARQAAPPAAVAPTQALRPNRAGGPVAAPTAGRTATLESITSALARGDLDALP